ncbi:MAG TPA: hypothetical protein VMJ10_12880 [Kofleriaceae bacterium]|nr:hypothetical protein [Kofleriaceae bacterium]
MRRNACLALVLAGCLSKPPAAPPDAAGDGGPDPCSAGPTIVDNFDTPGAPPCGSGIAVGATVAIDSNALQLAPMPTAGCSWSGVPTGSNGIEVQDLTALTTAEGDDVALAIADGAYTLQLDVGVTSTGPMLELGDSNHDAPLAAIPYQPGAQWWRLRVLDATTYVGEYATDENGPWLLLAMAGVAATASAVTVTVTATQGTASPSTASFDNVRACSP